MRAAPHIHGKRRTFSASHAVEVQGATLWKIKDEEGLTYDDLGRYLGGKSDDRAAAYAPHPDSERPVSAVDMLTFLAACEAFGGRFADPLLALVGGRWADLGDVCSSDPGALTLATLLPAIIESEKDGVSSEKELAPHEALIRKVNQLTAGWLRIIAEGDAK